MKKQYLAFALILMFLMGCANSPSVSITSLEGKDAYIASLSKKPYFTIITDGSISGGVSNTVFIGANYEGAIVSSDTGIKYRFEVKGDQLFIADQQFGFDRGCVFLVSTKDKLNISMANYTEIDKLRCLVSSDKKIIQFFNR